MSVDTYTTAGTFTWTCPAGATSVQVECIGGGGGNSSAGGVPVRGGGGGGGGAYSKSNSIAVTPGVGYTVTVGAGRAGSQNGGAAGSSSFVGDAGATCLAVGGVNASASSGGAGGAAASCTGDTKFSGGNGGSGLAGGGGGGGGGSSGGSAATGNNGTSTGGTSGGAGGTAPTGGGAGGRGGDQSANASIAAGSAPGGGAGGRCNAAAAARSGADGKVILTYTVASGNATITASVGITTLTGQSAGLRVARTLDAAVGTTTLTGQSAGLRAARRLTADVGTFALTGLSAGLRVNRALTAGTGTTTLTGQDAGLLISRVLTAEVGGFSFDGQDATLTYDDSASRPGDEITYALRIEYTTLFIPGAVDLGTFCEVPLDCNCPPVTAPPSPDGTLDPDAIPFWFYQYIIDTYSYAAGLFGGSLAAMVASAQCVVAAGSLTPDPSDPGTWDESYCATGTYDGWQSINRRWQSYLNLYNTPIISVDDPGLITVNYDRIQFPAGTRILDQRCEIATVEDVCCT